MSVQKLEIKPLALVTVSGQRMEEFTRMRTCSPNITFEVEEALLEVVYMGVSLSAFVLAGLLL